LLFVNEGGLAQTAKKRGDTLINGVWKALLPSHQWKNRSVWFHAEGRASVTAKHHWASGLLCQASSLHSPS